jgi:transmembrane 9 superfamily protein 2/4
MQYGVIDWNLFSFQSDFNKKNTFYIFNHVDIKLTYHNGEGEGWRGARLVAATLEPKR